VVTRDCQELAFKDGKSSMGENNQVQVFGAEKIPTTRCRMDNAGLGRARGRKTKVKTKLDESVRGEGEL